MYRSLSLSLLAALALTVAACHKPTTEANSSQTPADTQSMKTIPGSVEPVTQAQNTLNANGVTSGSRPAAAIASNAKITLQLGMPAKVKVYQQGKLFQQQVYDKAGTYSLNTNKWPSGVYQVVVQSAGGLSQVVVRQSFTFVQPMQ